MHMQLVIYSMVTYSKLLPGLVHDHSLWHQNLHAHTAVHANRWNCSSEFQHQATQAAKSYHFQICIDITQSKLSIHCPFQCILLYWPGFLSYSKFELLIGIHTNELLFRVLSGTKFSVYIPKWHSRRSRNAPIGCQLISPNLTGYVYIFGISAITMQPSVQ